MEAGLIILLLLLVPFTSYFGNQARHINNDVRCALFELDKDREPRAVAENGASAELLDSEEVSAAFRGTTGELWFLPPNLNDLPRMNSDNQVISEAEAAPKDVPGVLRSTKPVATSPTTSRPSRSRPRDFSESRELDFSPAFRAWLDSSGDSDETSSSSSEISLESDSDEIGREFTFPRRSRRGRRGLVRIAVTDGS
ncbi:hypothetical protein ANCCAN_19638 [Ancylostoma caninum]|uniref:Secreted protein n=1 Tax=Ancylostoma caninum TaxID=29170 RepID=A0A368FUP2_ANCCA|nr:hypothetical protein ANCCAN_19638 [Ancylostoma caninum]